LFISWATKEDFKWRLKLYKDEQFLMETGMEFHVAAIAEGSPNKINRTD